MKIDEFRLPKIGQRIVRSASAVLMCFLIYYFRGRRGIPLYSAIAALQCIQQYSSNSVNMTKKRIGGTIIGAVWGFIALWILSYVFPNSIQDTLFGYLVIAIFTGIVLYTTVLIEHKQASFLACVVFLSIVTMHLTDEPILIPVMDRVVDTLLGVGIGMLINTIHLPRVRKKDILFVTGIDDILLDQQQRLTPYNEIELNRLIEGGAKFTIATQRTPASLMEVVGNINMKLPMIVMDGAAIYDVNENSYLLSYILSYQQAITLINFLSRYQLNYFANVIIDHLLVIYYNKLENSAEKAIYEKKKKSPYRNYVNRDLPEGENVVYFMVINREERILECYQELMKQEWVDGFKIRMYPSTEYPGFSYLKIYQKNVSRQNMLFNLKAMLNIEQSITFGSVRGECDVLIENSNSNLVVRKLRKLYEPIGVDRKECMAYFSKYL